MVAPGVRGSHPLRRPVPGDSEGTTARSILSKLQLGPPETARFQIWAAAASLAVTEAIPVGFFSSAY